MKFEYDDGGRAAAGYRGNAGDCVVRAVAITTQQPYQTVYDALTEGCRGQRLSKWSPRRKASARDGVAVQRAWFKRYLASLGWVWYPTMGIGTGCQTHLRAEELPSGRLIVNVSRHMVAVIDGIIHDIYDDQRNGRRCVYGYWKQGG